MVASSLAVASSLLAPAGCGTAYEDCFTNGLCASLKDGGVKPICKGSPTSTMSGVGKPEPPTEDCAVFVRADATPAQDAPGATLGTRDNPYGSLQAAITGANGKWVIACDVAPFVEDLKLFQNVQIYGGFDCSDPQRWTWDEAARTSLVGKATDDSSDIVALSVDMYTDTVKLENLTITSDKATKPSGSSIAVSIEGAATTVTISRCEVTSGDGAAGENGVSQGGTGTPGTKGEPPNPATGTGASAACMAPPRAGDPGVLSCDDGMTSGGAGGKGGIQGVNNGNGLDSGESGQAGDSADASGGTGGPGLSVPPYCQNGMDGKDGDPGAPGPGGSLADPDGKDGQAGRHGLGGGGGGGAKAGKLCGSNQNPYWGVGASGGGGGSGGCGGRAGGGGKRGGSSIAIRSASVHLTLIGVTLTTGDGGKGGDGGNGQQGGAPGAGAIGGSRSGVNGSVNGCTGGSGGRGGDGGPGGGGMGGHALGIAFKSSGGVQPVVTFVPGKPGAGGVSGKGGPMSGAAGLGGDKMALCMDISDPLNPTPCPLTP